MMNDTDKNRFAQIMYGVADNFRDGISKEGLKMRFDVLKRFTIEEIENAAHMIMSNRVFTKMPPVAEFIECIEGKAEDKAEMAVLSLTEKIRKIGYYGSPDFEDPITDTLFRTRFGWKEICCYTVAEMNWFLKDFKTAYLAFERTEKIKQIEPTKRLKLLSGGIGKSI